MTQRLLTFLFFCAAAFAQTDSGTIRIFVADATEAPIVEAKVTLTNVATGIVTERETGAEGYAVFAPSCVAAMRPASPRSASARLASPESTWTSTSANLCASTWPWQA